MTNPYRSLTAVAARVDQSEFRGVPEARPGGFGELVAHGLDLFSRHGPDGGFLEVSPAATQVLGRLPAALLSMSWLDIVEESDRDRVAAWWRLLSTGPQPLLSFRAAKPDGELIWLESAAATLRSHRGTVVEVQLMTRDVTRHLARLEEVRERASRLEQANRELSAFAADVAHDLRSPLQAISGFAELLARREGARLDEMSQSFIVHILGATSVIQELVAATLEFRQSSSAVLHTGPVDCGNLVQGVLMQLQQEVDDTGAEIEIGDLPLVVADRVQLGRVFQNLITNALRATPPDQPPKISVSARRLPDAWELSVSDRGIGVPDEDRQRIFELFQRGTPSAHGKAPGHGLGLSICRTVVERHGGRIGVERVPGGGSRFCFTVPDRLMGSTDA